MYMKGTRRVRFNPVSYLVGYDSHLSGYNKIIIGSGSVDIIPNFC